MTVRREAQSHTTPSPRNAPPLSDRDRLVEIVQRFQWNRTMDSLVDALLAEGVTLPPEKAGPVTSEEAAHMVSNLLSFGLSWDNFRRRMDTELLPLLARDHGLLTREEVERRAGEWLRWWPVCDSMARDSLVAHLTRPAPRVAGGAKSGGPDGR